MAKITRAPQKVFGSTAGLNQIAQFGSLAQAAPAYTTNPTTIQALGAYLTGWFGAVIGSNSPAIEDMNAICYLYAYQLAYAFQAGIAEWDSATTYYIGSFVTVNSTGLVYRSIVDTNLNNAVSDTTKWAVAFQPNASASISSADTTMTSTDGIGVWYFSTGASNRTLNLAAAASCKGRMFALVKTDNGAGTVIIDPNSTELINGASTYTINLQNDAVIVQSDGTGWYVTGQSRLASGSVSGRTSSYSPLVASSVLATASANAVQTSGDGVSTYLFSTGGTNRTFTLATPSTQAGRVFYVKKTDSGVGQVSIVGTIDGVSNYTLYVQNDAITISCDGTAYYIISKSLVVNSQVRSDTGNAVSYGSTDNKIRRINNHVTVGTGITPLTTAANGTTYTIVQPGVYVFSRTDVFVSGGTYIGFSLNSVNLTTTITALNAAERVDSTRTVASEIGSCSASIFLTTGDIIRPHDSGTCDSTSNQVQFVITQQSRV